MCGRQRRQRWSAHTQPKTGCTYQQGRRGGRSHRTAYTLVAEDGTCAEATDSNPRFKGCGVDFVDQSWKAWCKAAGIARGSHVAISMCSVESHLHIAPAAADDADSAQRQPDGAESADGSQVTLRTSSPCCTLSSPSSAAGWCHPRCKRSRCSAVQSSAMCDFAGLI